MKMQLSLSAVILSAISVVGAVAIPFGNPEFLDRAVALELAFITLAALIFMGIRKALYACIPLAVAVIVANSMAPPHVEVMTTFSKPLNAVLLIIGGYVLQVALVGATIFELRESRWQGITQQQKP